MQSRKLGLSVKGQLVDDDTFSRIAVARVAASAEELAARVGRINTIVGAKAALRTTESWAADFGSVLQEGVAQKVTSFMAALRSDDFSLVFESADQLEKAIDILTSLSGVEDPKSLKAAPRGGLERLIYRYYGRQLDEALQRDGDDVAADSSQDATEMLSFNDMIRLAALEMFCIGFQCGMSLTEMANLKNKGDAARSAATRAKQTKGLRDANRTKLKADMEGVQSAWEERLPTSTSPHHCDQRTATHLSNEREKLELPTSTDTIYRYRMANWDPDTYYQREARRKNATPKNGSRRRNRGR